MFTKKEIYEMCKIYDIKCENVSEVIDTSKDAEDLRYNYFINNQYVLKISSAVTVNEKFLKNAQDLILRYKKTGVYCPEIKQTKYNTFLGEYVKNDISFVYYMEEKSKYNVKEEKEHIDYIFKKQMLGHLGKLASEYVNVDLIETKSMWSLIELSPYDKEIDEKQDNFNELIPCLKAINQKKLAEELSELNNRSRKKIKEYMKRLPRCVFQGDLNDSNILVDKQGKFQGLIDFNMYGTEININCFLNESMYYITQDDFEKLTGVEILNKVIRVQEDLLTAITSQYHLNQEEEKAKHYYNDIIYTSFWPNVVLMIQLINENRYVDKIIEFLSEVLKRESEKLE